MKNKSVKIILKNEAELQKEAERIAGLVLGSQRNHHAMTIGLIGDLGAGKTAFAKYFLRALGVRESVLSPTFIIMRPYKIERENFSTVYHFDWYRVESEQEILSLGFENISANPNHIMLIEWADKFLSLLPEKAVKIFFEHGATKDERVVRIENL